MIDERHEELAALYALDLLEGPELPSFESALARDPALQTLVRQLRETGASLAYAAPAATPPAALRARVLASISAAAPASAPIIRPPASVFRTVAPWAIAAGFALCAAWLGQRTIALRSESALLRDTQAQASIALKSAEQQLEAERILARRQLSDTEQKLADAARAAQDTRTQLADARAQLSQRDTQLAALTQRVDALSTSASDLGRQLGASQQRLVALSEQLRREADLANLKITALASKLNNSPEAIAIAVWNPAKQEGVLQVEKLPALAADRDYQLWVVDPQYPDPVDAGTFTVDPATGARRISFKSKHPIKDIAAYAITQEVKGGVVKSAGPFLLLGK